MPINKSYNLVNSTGQSLTFTRATVNLTDGDIPISFDTDSSSGLDTFEISGDNLNIITSYSATAVTGTLNLFYDLLATNCSKQVNIAPELSSPTFTFSTIGNSESPGTAIDITVNKTNNTIVSTWVLDNSVYDTNSFSAVPISNPATIELHIFRQNETASNYLSIDASNSFLVGELDLTIFDNLVTGDFSNNQLTSVILGNDILDKDEAVSLDFRNNSLDIQAIRDLLFSFEPTFHSTARLIDVRGQGFTIFDEVGLQDEILTRVLALEAAYNIQVLGDFEFGSYVSNYIFDYD